MCTFFLIVPLWCHYIANFSNQPTPGIQSAFNKAVPGLDAPCNQECHCDNIPITPVCGIDQRHYFSPCHAGCEDMVLDGETKKVRIKRHWNIFSWWRHQIETFSALLALCAGNSPVTGEFPHKCQWLRALMFSLICAWTNGWINNRGAGDLRRQGAHYDVTVKCYFSDTIKKQDLS